MTRDGVPPPSPAGDGPRRCSQCGQHGHNARTCTGRPVKLFGVRIGDSPVKKSASMGNLAQLAEGSGGARDGGYGSEGDDHKPKKRGEAWSEEEHKNFLLGLTKLGKGDWRGISRNYVVSRTPTQVASHAQKYFIRQTNVYRRKRRSSLFDMVVDDSADQPLSRSSSQEVSLSRSSSQDVEEYLDDPQPITAHEPVLTSVPPAVQVMAQTAHVPVVTSISAQPPVPTLEPPVEGSESVLSSFNAGEAGIMMPQVMPPYGYPMMFPPPYYPQPFVPVPNYGYAPIFYGQPGTVQESHEFYGPSGTVQASHEFYGPSGTVQASHEFYGPSGTVQASHAVVKPVAAHLKPPVNVEDLYNMSELSLKGDSDANGAGPESSLPPTSIGRPERRSAFHGKGSDNGSSNGLIPAK